MTRRRLDRCRSSLDAPAAMQLVSRDVSKPTTMEVTGELVRPSSTRSCGRWSPHSS